MNITSSPSWHRATHPHPPTTASQLHQMFGSVSDLDDEYAHKQHHLVKKYEVFESPNDILALSVAWARLREQGLAFGKISRLLDAELFQELIDSDFVQAAKIRDHYSKKFLMWTLTEVRLSNYRRDLSEFINSDGLVFRENMLGLAYHLPTFYEYDKQLDEVRLKVESTAIPQEALYQCTRTLKPMKRIVFKNSGQHKIQYWMQDTETNTAALIALDAKNPLEHVWNNIFDLSPTLDVSGFFKLDSKENFTYAEVKQWSLAKS